ncbi:gamma-glutamyl-gamma-aminobutyrate hydrolase [Thermococcus sp. P6]|uniref:gamma-glutamyl-gamma-aminobutyrate hydrolase family protein n=1 Tax=Thermococcus sp. P6 TaxID=122420 RepID=UPI000B59D5AC|nr:gamma-glutamyl-gamma-aminobutyrate hydrolase family protein [Thermococcus sp. P6]ASJ10205.1 gamma-glutamyl-gamma-aminobutyrate hydrolase [Thermococcus sp. P6]
MKPLIGMVGQRDPSGRGFSIGQRHLDIIAAAGGVPAVFGVNVSPEEVIEHVDGLLLVEGPDVHPHFYGEDPSDAIRSVDVERDEFEIRLVKMAVDRGLPVLGISRGMHVINTALGGTLYQDLKDIPKTIKHDWSTNLTDPGQRVHGLRIKSNSRLYRILREALNIEGTSEVYLRVNSFHHQAVKKVGDGIKPVAYAVDGLVEAIEGDEGFLIGVQWQPEYLPEMMNLFEAFVEAALEYRTKKLELERVEIEAEVREALKGERDGNHHSSETTDNPPGTSQT